MRITCFLLFVSVFHLLAIPSDAQNSLLRISQNQLTVGEFIEEIEEQTTYLVIFSNNEIDIERTLTLKENNGRISDYLKEAFRGDDINYRFENNYIILSKSPVISGTQQERIQITGTVIDENREAVIGANIMEEGTQNGTVTHLDGSFSLTVSPEAVLIITYIGYQPQRVPVAGKSTFLIELNENTQALEEVVIIGYGTQKKVNLTGSVASVNAEEIQDIPASSLSNALSGKLAGVFIKQTGGRPGAGSSVTVRAHGTWNNTDPLYVIDGVVRDKMAFDGLDASEVENLSVLKDGASAAIYGARAANGVILVSTKKGQMGKPVVSYTGSIGISDATIIPKTQNAYNQAIFTNDYLQVENVDPSDARYYSADELEFFRHNNWNWLDEAWKRPILTRHSINVSGGNERVRYFVGGTYYYETGSFDNLNYDKYNLRSNIEADITKNLKATVNINMDVRKDHKPYWRYDDYENEEKNEVRMVDLYKALLFRTGQVPPYVNGLPTGSYVEWHPLEIIADHTGYNDKKYTNYEANIALQYDVPFIEGLSLRFQYNKYNRHAFIKKFNRPYDLYEFRMTGEHNHIITDEVASVKTRNDGDFLYEKYDVQDNYQLNAYVTYAQRFGKHDVGALFVYEQSAGKINWFNGQVNYFISSAIDELFAGSSDAKNSSVTGRAEENGRLSYVGRLNYGYDEKYLFEASFRYDGSVIFAPQNRWGFFPSGSAAWRISEENFFKDNVRFMNYLKLRASIGLLGNDAVGGWQWLQRYKFESGAYFGSLSNGIEAEVIPNESITWEKSLTYNAGFDTKFLNNRLSLDFDVFYRHTYDILGARNKSLPTTFGAKMPEENYAVIDAKGFELELGYSDKIGTDFRYYVKGNLAYAVNKVKTKDEAENLRPYKSEIGYSTDRKMGYIATGIIRTQAELDALPEDYTIFGQKPELGMLNYKDLRGANSDEPDGRIDEDDKDWIINHTNPPVNYGLSLGGSWNGFSLDIFLQGVAGNDSMINQRGSQARPQETNFDFWTDHWTPQNPNAEFPRAARNASGEESTFWVRDGSFLRLKNISLSYAFPKKITSQLKVSQLKVFLIGNNVCLLQNKLKYFDPENGEINAYPLMKSYSFGVNLSF